MAWEDERAYGADDSRTGRDQGKDRDGQYVKRRRRVAARGSRDAPPRLPDHDGADQDWASWYADWLISLSELPALLNAKPARSELVYLLVGLDKDYTARQPDESWESYYARRITEHFGQPSQAGTTQD